MAEGLNVCLQTEDQELVGRERRCSQKEKGTEECEGVSGTSGVGGRHASR